MNGTNHAATGTKAVTDAGIQSALTILTALKSELKAHTKRRMDRIPDNEAWNEKATHIDFDLRGGLESIQRVKLELKHWSKRRLEKALRNPGN